MFMWFLFLSGVIECRANRTIWRKEGEKDYERKLLEESE